MRTTNDDTILILIYRLQLAVLNFTHVESVVGAENRKGVEESYRKKVVSSSSLYSVPYVPNGPSTLYHMSEGSRKSVLK